MLGVLTLYLYVETPSSKVFGCICFRSFNLSEMFLSQIHAGKLPGWLHGCLALSPRREIAEASGTGHWCSIG